MKKIVKKVKWVLLIVGILGVMGGIVLFATPFGHDVRTTAAEMLMSSQHRHWAKYTFLPEKELAAILKNIQHPVYKNTVLNEERKEEQAEEQNKLTIKIESLDVYYSTGYFYKGKVLEVSNPSNVKLVTSKLENQGEQVFVQAKRAGAIAATNASGFVDVNGVGNGGSALGLVIEEGVVKAGGNKANFVAALTKKGDLLTGKFEPEALLRMDVRYAAGFKPQLISNGIKMIEGDGGWGIGPRTAMGQKADGTIVFVVIDGRQVMRSMGATIQEVQNIMYERGVVNAISMDGGSSSIMYFNGETVTTPSSVNNIPRYLPNIWAVIPKEGQTLEVYVDGEQLDENQLTY